MTDFKVIRKKAIIIGNAFEHLDKTRETSLALTAVQNASMFCGSFLKYSGLGENPYAKNDGKRKDVKDIEPLHDKPSISINFQSDKNQIEKVDFLRTQIQELIDEVVKINVLTKPGSIKNIYLEHICCNEVVKNLISSRHWLGMELGRIRDNS